MNKRHPVFPLAIVDEHIVGPTGIVGYVDYGEQYVYVCFYDNKLVVAEHNTFDSIATRCAENIIRNKYYYAFKILCAGGATAVTKCLPKDIMLIGIISGYLENGTRVWYDASETTWAGVKV